MNKDKILYTLKHKEVLVSLTNLLFPNNTQLMARIEIHDNDKLFNLQNGMDSKQASKLHRQNATHHLENKNCDLSEIGILEIILDWESAGFTKPDKPLNAYDTLLNYYNKYTNIFMPFLIKYNMNYSYNVNEKYPTVNK